jgi:hypothetical protein
LSVTVVDAPSKKKMFATSLMTGFAANAVTLTAMNASPISQENDMHTMTKMFGAWVCVKCGNDLPTLPSVCA